MKKAKPKTVLRPFKTALLLVAFLNLAVFKVKAQESSLEKEYKRISFVVGMPFHNFAVPLRDLGSNFTHPGLFLGSEIPYNKKGTLIQQVTLGGYLNREIGNGLFINTQFGYRPKVFNDLYGELKVGLGYIRVFHPTQAYEFNDGQWNETNGGKSQLGIPLDFGFGYSFETKYGELSPHITYQVTPALFYNDTLPLNIYTNIIVGLRMKLLGKK